MFFLRGVKGVQPSVPVQVIYSGAGVAVPSTFFGMTMATPYETVSATYDIAATVDATANTFTIASNNGRLARSQKCEVYSTGAVPAPLVQGQSYWIVDVSGGVSFAVSATEGGPPIDLTDAGSGTITVRIGAVDPGAGYFGTVRSLDTSCGTWAQINTANGVYDWTLPDAWIPYHYARGRAVLFTFNQTPAWSAVNAALDVYGASGGGQAPSSLSHAATFATALLARYNATSPINPTGARMIWGIEAWNEPSFQSPGTVGQSWCATHAQLAEQTRNVYNAAKAADASCTVLGPGFTSGMADTTPTSAAHAVRYLDASDGDGGKGKDWMDGYCYHGYGPGAYQSNLVDLKSAVSRIRSLATFGGLSTGVPLYQTERGIETSAGAFTGLRAAVIEAALGVKTSVHYAYNFSTFVALHTDAALLAKYAEVNAAIAGKAITYCALMQDGRVTATADGATVVV